MPARGPRCRSARRLLSDHDVYEEPELARESFRALPAEARRLSGVDFSGANRACPHGVDVASLMDRASKVLS
jgi:hypothetical protein